VRVNNPFNPPKKSLKKLWEKRYHMNMDNEDTPKTYYERHREERLAYQRRYNEAHQEQQRENQRRYRERHPEKQQERMRLYYLRNKKRLCAKSRRRYWKNKPAVNSAPPKP
jgi:hypothetical protein